MNGKIITIVLASLVLLAACKKEDIDWKGSLASVRVINAAVNSGTVKVNYLGRPVYWLSYVGADGSVAYGAQKVYSITDATSIYPFKVVPALDTLKPVFDGKLNLEPKAGYSLYFSGVAPTYDTVFVKENLPKYADSVLAVRVINLVSNSGPVNVTLSATPSANEFSNLSYRQQVAFKTFPATYKQTNTYFTFQVRNSGGTLLASYVFTAANMISTRFRGATLVFRGQIGATGTNAPGISFVPNY